MSPRTHQHWLPGPMSLWGALADRRQSHSGSHLPWLSTSTEFEYPHINIDDGTSNGPHVIRAYTPRPVVQRLSLAYTRAPKSLPRVNYPAYVYPPRYRPVTLLTKITTILTLATDGVNSNPVPESPSDLGAV